MHFLLSLTSSLDFKRCSLPIEANLGRIYLRSNCKSIIYGSGHRHSMRIFQNSQHSQAH